MGRRVLVVDDHALFRAGLAQLIESKGYEIAGQADKSADALTLARSLKPDIVTLDVEVDDVPVGSVIRGLRRILPEARIVVITMYRDRVIERSVLESGANAFLSKSAPNDEVLSALMGRQLSTPRTPRTVARALLSPREAEVMRLLTLARTNREIATELSIAEGTVKRHTGSIYEKLGVRSRLEAVSVASRLGLNESA